MAHNPSRARGPQEGHALPKGQPMARAGGGVLLTSTARHTSEALAAVLQRAGHQVVQASTSTQVRDAVARGGIGAAVLATGPDEGTSMKLLSELRAAIPRAPVIVVTGEEAGMASTVLAMREGAFDCLSHPLDPDHLLERLQDALRLTPAQALAVVDVEEDARARAAELVGRSRVMREVFKKLGLLASSRATVLLRGESGTGKEVAARVLHHFGPAGADAPFVAVHCAAIPRPLFEAELFGHRRGAFTGAERDRPGKLEQAAEGTLFLDEVGDIPLEAQVKLLRVLQERRLERLGDEQPRAFNARVVAATHRDLAAMVREGQFREDLYYRLNVAAITLPPLRERREDVPLIAQRLLSEVAREVGRRVDGLSVNAVEKLCMTDWPGNVRELRNVLTRAVVRCRGRLVDEDDIDLGADQESSALRAPDRFPTLDEAEREHVRRALELAKGHRARACALLGVSRPTLLRKIRRYGLEKGLAPTERFVRSDPESGTERSDGES